MTAPLTADEVKAMVERAAALVEANRRAYVVKDGLDQAADVLALADDAAQPIGPALLQRLLPFDVDGKIQHRLVALVTAALDEVKP